MSLSFSKKNKSFYTKNKERILQLRPLIAYEYHYKNKNLVELSREFKVCRSAAKNAKENYTLKDVKNLKGGGEAVLVVDVKHLKEAYNTLKSIGIRCRYAHHEHELIEKYESKINGRP